MKTTVDENEVIEAVVESLQYNGYEIIQKLNTKEKGDDIIAKNTNGSILKIEAKGGTSTFETSNRYGKPYTKSQVFDRVAKGLLTVLMKNRSKEENEKIGLAIPGTDDFRNYLSDLKEILMGNGISLYLVNLDNSVEKF